jgi:hypothetical protein
MRLPPWFGDAASAVLETFANWIFRPRPSTPLKDPPPAPGFDAVEAENDARLRARKEAEGETGRISLTPVPPAPKEGP